MNSKLSKLLRIFVMGMLILINYVLQTTFWAEFAIMGVTPDTALILIVGYGILRGDVEGAIFGFSAGILQDIFSGMYIGVFALFGFLTGYAAGSPFRSFFKNNYLLPFFLVIVVSLVHQFLLYIATMLFMGQLDFSHYFSTVIFPTTIYTASVSIPIFAFLYFVNAKIEAYEKGRRHMFTNSTDQEE